MKMVWVWLLAAVVSFSLGAYSLAYKYYEVNNIVGGSCGSLPPGSGSCEDYPSYMFNRLQAGTAFALVFLALAVWSFISYRRKRSKVDTENKGSQNG